MITLATVVKYALLVISCILQEEDSYVGAHTDKKSFNTLFLGVLCSVALYLTCTAYNYWSLQIYNV